jgi:hypothetical protein
MSAAGTHTKGAAVRAFLRWHEGSQRERVQRAAAAVPAEHRHLLDPRREALGILPSLWYPSELVHALVDDLTAGLDESELERLAREGGRAIIKDSLGGVYKVLFNFLVSPERYAKNADRIWRVFHDSGSNEMSVVGPSEHLSRIVDWRGHHPFICRLHRATTGHLYGEMKCKEVALTDEGCLGRGDAACVTRIAWK